MATQGVPRWLYTLILEYEDSQEKASTWKTARLIIGSLLAVLQKVYVAFKKEIYQKNSQHKKNKMHFLDTIG